MAYPPAPHGCIGKTPELSSTKNKKGCPSPGGSPGEVPKRPVLRGMVKKSDKWRQLSPRARSVFDTLWEFGGKADPNEAGGYLLTCWPKRSRLAECEGCSLATIDRALNELRAAGLVEWCNNPKRLGKHNVYTLFVPSEMVAANLADHEQQNDAGVTSPTQQACGVERVGSDAMNAADLTRSLNPLSEHVHKEHHHPNRPDDRRKLPTMTKPTTNPGAGGGIDFLTGEEAEKTKREALEVLTKRGVQALKPIRRRLDAGQLTPEEIRAVVWHADRQTNDVGPGMLVAWLSSERTDERTGIVAEYRADREREAKAAAARAAAAERLRVENERKAAELAERKRVQGAAQASMGVATERAAKEQANGDNEAAARIGRNVELVKGMVGSNGEGAWGRLTPEQRAELLSLEPWAAFVKLATWAKTQQDEYDQVMEERRRLCAELDRKRQEEEAQWQAAQKAKAEETFRRNEEAGKKKLAEDLAMLKSASDEDLGYAWARAAEFFKGSVVTDGTPDDLRRLAETNTALMKTLQSGVRIREQLRALKLAAKGACA